MCCVLQTVSEEKEKTAAELEERAKLAQQLEEEKKELEMKTSDLQGNLMVYRGVGTHFKVGWPIPPLPPQ